MVGGYLSITSLFELVKTSCQNEVMHICIQQIAWWIFEEIYFTLNASPKKRLDVWVSLNRLDLDAVGLVVLRHRCTWWAVRTGVATRGHYAHFATLCTLCYLRLHCTHCPILCYIMHIVRHRAALCTLCFLMLHHAHCATLCPLCFIILHHAHCGTLRYIIHIVLQYATLCSFC